MAKARKQRTQKLQIVATRRGEVRFDTQYTAIGAARSAVKLAKQGYLVDVKADHSGHLKMHCVAVKRRGRSDAPGTFTKGGAHCTMKPAFKKQVKGLAGLR